MVAIEAVSPHELVLDIDATYKIKSHRTARGDVAQLGERGVRNAEVRGSTPLISTICNMEDMHTFRMTIPGIISGPLFRIKGDQLFKKH